MKQNLLAVFKRNRYYIPNKIGTSESTVHRNMGRSGFSWFKFRKVQEWIEEKEIIAKSRARKLYAKCLTNFDCAFNQEFYVARHLSEVSPKYEN